MNELSQKRLRKLPGVDKIIEAAKSDADFVPFSQGLVTEYIRKVIDRLRARIIADPSEIPEALLTEDAIIETIKTQVRIAGSPNLRPLVNATGIVIHTNLGRSVLSHRVLDNVYKVAAGYSNLEYDLTKGKRGSRYSLIREILCDITGAQDAMVVNNNAGAVLLCLDTIARGKTVIVSRGELVEIGGAFRIPDVMIKSGACLKEVGTTNRTHLKDYENAVDPDTGLLLKVHTSNYSIIGFTASVSLNSLVSLGNRLQVPVMEDLGSGTFVDFSRHGLAAEPMVQDSVRSGADIITFSGDKLLGGPQAGIILGTREMLNRIKMNPLTRALRIDKLTLAALESTLQLYRDETLAVNEIPTLRMIMAPMNEIEHRARDLRDRLLDLHAPDMKVDLLDLDSRAGGGSLPMLEIPSKCLGIRVTGMSPNTLEKGLRKHSPPVICRIENDYLVMDPRTIQADEIETIVDAIEAVLGT
ncbi:MAG: L-seryl-tRNA(Sec) selenium transferase [Desulfobacteraceae bacterium]|nr:L-seryl-tRNA(Sec) selenium transferase [Desulfobacteraceae bacterium]